MDKIVYIVHCIDTEGPLYEPIATTFERLYEIFGIKLEPSEESLWKIQNKEFDFKNKDLIAEVFCPHLLNYNDTWDKIDNMHSKILSDEYRNSHKDSFGNGWIYNWFCVDHVDYETNPRRRDMGYHNIYDHYQRILKEYTSLQDGLHFHFHPMSVYKEAHRCAYSYINSPHLYQVLCRRIIERNYFPAAYRAGFQAERPDSNWFLEQWISFDFSNWVYHSSDAHQQQQDLKDGRSGDWRLAPDDWSVYHPSHDSWQIPGTCRRWIARCLDIMTRGRDLSELEVEKAFSRANEGKPTLMCFNNHDFRDMAVEVDYAYSVISKVSKRYQDVKFKYCEAVEGFRSSVYGRELDFEPVELKIEISGDNKMRELKVDTIKGKVFGPQPFLAVRTKSGRFIHDNFDFTPSLTKWTYTFDYDSIHADDISVIGVATGDKYGNTFIKNVSLG